MKGRLLTVAATLTLIACNGDDAAPTTDLTTTADTATMAGETAASTARQGEVTLLDANGDTVGHVMLHPAGQGVHMMLTLRGLPPGEKGLHFHEVGQCDPPTFESAGSHFAPGGRQHGFDNPQGPHAGDLRNVVVGEDGTASQEFTTDRVTLGEGPNSLYDDDGTALVLHAGPDDYRTDPSGNSGDRIACGVVTRM
jgi:superoxide dismutase, Cu-Zn family